jgi:hypothetical protein
MTHQLERLLNVEWLWWTAEVWYYPCSHIQWLRLAHSNRPIRLVPLLFYLKIGTEPALEASCFYYKTKQSITFRIKKLTQKNVVKQKLNYTINKVYLNKLKKDCPENRGSIFLQALVPIYQITRCHIPEDHTLLFITVRTLNVRSVINLSKLATNCRFNSWQGQEIFLFSTATRLALASTKPPIQWVPNTTNSFFGGKIAEVWKW